MSVILRGMKMPKDCFECMVDCPVGTQRFIVTGRPRGCPLIEIPTPHGRLIDIDDAIESYGEIAELGYVSQSKFLNVVIETEGSKE